ncbi:hypothetical protein OHR68_11595 [Spirillospora sp. NBC_00431]
MRSDGYEAEFRRLITEQRLDPPVFFRDLPDAFGYDEPPLYAHYHQLGFLDALPTAEKNHVLIRAAVRHLRALVEHKTRQDIYCMLSIQRWDEWENGGLIDPRFFTAFLTRRPDPADPRGVLDYLIFNAPTSHYSAFTATALHHDPTLTIHEDIHSTPHEPRVYVRPSLYWSTPYQIYR